MTCSILAGVGQNLKTYLKVMHWIYLVVSFFSKECFVILEDGVFAGWSLILCFYNQHLEPTLFFLSEKGPQHTVSHVF